MNGWMDVSQPVVTLNKLVFAPFNRVWKCKKDKNIKKSSFIFMTCSLMFLEVALSGCLNETDWTRMKSSQCYDRSFLAVFQGTEGYWTTWQSMCSSEECCHTPDMSPSSHHWSVCKFSQRLIDDAIDGLKKCMVDYLFANIWRRCIVPSLWLNDCL